MTAVASVLGGGGAAGCDPLPPTGAALALEPGLGLDQGQQATGQAGLPGSLEAHHPNIFVRGLPLAWGEAELASVFSQAGEVTSIRLVRHSVTKHSLGYGFVRYSSVQDAQAAIMALDGTTVLGHKLQVKFADADAGPPAAASPSGLTPSDSCYAKHLPASWGAREVQQLFELHGPVLDVKLFPCLDQFRGASALIRMASIEAAERAITALNNTTPTSGVQSLIVRFAESAAEKAARLQRRERQQQQQAAAAVGRGQPGLSRAGHSSGSLTAVGSQGMLGAPPVLLSPEQQLQQALTALNLGSEGALGLHPLYPPMGLPGMGLGGGNSMLRPPAATMAMASPIQFSYQPPVLSSIAVRGLPQQADRLWMYEHFSRFGAIAGLRVVFDEVTGMCSGSGFVDYADPAAAERARQVLNGARAGDKVLQVAAQQAAQGQQPGAHLGSVRPGLGFPDAPSASSSPLQLGFTHHDAWQSIMPSMQGQL